MKKILVVVLVVAIALIGASAAMAGIATTKHDLSGGSTTEICVFCHTPHNSVVTRGPLWNRNAGTTTFTMYDVQVSNTVTGVDTDISASSLGCMSCHDGVTALNALVNYPGDGSATQPTANPVSIGSFASIGNGGGNLTDDHPIAILYNAPTSDVTGLNAATGAGVTVKVTAANTAPTGSDGTAKVQCESCHLVHDNTNAPFLRASNAGSGLCLACHNK